VGTTGSGWLTDRWDSRKLLFGYYGFRGLSLVFLPAALVAQGPGLTAFTIFYGLDWIATVPPTVRLCTEAFGRRDGTILFGWVLVAHQLGGSVAALGAGWTREAWGDYRPAFLASGMLCFVAASLAMAVGRRPPAPLEPLPDATAG
jgi:predicted MFS family arabinose efflux permease